MKIKAVRKALKRYLEEYGNLEIKLDGEVPIRVDGVDLEYAGDPEPYVVIW